MGVTSSRDKTNYSFGRFEIDSFNRVLLSEGVKIPMTPKIFDMLLLLVENNGRMVTKDEIMNSVWADTFVEETNLTSNISRLRKILHAGGTDYIETLPKRGYRFNAGVEQVRTPSEMIFSRRTTARIRQTIEENGAEPTLMVRQTTSVTWKWFFVAALVAASLAGAAMFWNWGISVTGNPAAFKTVAVLPFKPLVAENRDVELEMGMADTLIARLGNNREIIVRPLSSVRRFDTLGQDAIAAGRHLGVEAVLDGSLQRRLDKIRVNVRLIRVADGTTLWADTFDEKFTDIFVLQDAISNRVASALVARESGDEKTSAGKRHTTNPEAYESYVRGRYHYFKTTKVEIHKAISFYKRAIEIDPAYAVAYAGLADAYRTLPIAYGASSKESFPLAKEAALRALDLDSSLAEAHAVLGWVSFWHEWNWSEAESQFRKAIELAPNNADAHRALAHLLSNIARHDEAISESALARQLDPISLITSALDAQFLFYGGRDADALSRLNKTLEIEPNFWITHNSLGRHYIRQRDYPKAIEVLGRARELSGGSHEATTQIGYAQAKSGNRAAALATLGDLRSLAAVDYVPAYSIAVIHNGLGQTNEALSHLEKSFDEREVQLTFVKIDERWNTLAGEPRFIDIMTRMNFKPE